MSEHTGTDGDVSTGPHGAKIREGSRVLITFRRLAQVLRVAVVTSRLAAAVRWFDQTVVTYLRVVDEWMTASVVWSLLFAVPDDDDTDDGTDVTPFLDRLGCAVHESRLVRWFRHE